MRQVKRKTCINIFSVPPDLQRPGIYLCVWRARDTVLGLPAVLLPRLLKPAAGYTTRAWEQSSVIHLSIPFSPSTAVAAAGVMDDITQQGFAQRYYHGTGISMEPRCLPSRAIDWGLVHDPNLLKGPSERRRSSSTIWAPGINSDRSSVLNHPDSSPAASVFPRLITHWLSSSPFYLLPSRKCWLNHSVPTLADPKADGTYIHSGVLW